MTRKNNNNKEDSMSTRTQRAEGTKLHFSVCLIGLLLVFSLAAQGQQVHQLFYDNSAWADYTLNPSVTAASSGVGAFATTPNDGLHVYYASNTGQIHQLYNVGGGWHNENLSAETKGPPANSLSNVVGLSLQNLQYVFYIDNAFNLHQLFYNNSVWKDTNLSEVYGVPGSDGQELAAFVTTPNNALHVYYVTPGPSIIQAYNVGNGWQYQDLTGLTRGGQPEGRSLTGFSIGNLQYLYYVAFGGDVHQLYYNNARWTDEDLTALTSTSPSPEYPNGAVSALVIPGTKKLRVYYIDTSDHVIQLSSTNNEKWTGLDLTKRTRGPLADSSNASVAFATTPNNQIHVFYASGGHVHQLFLPTPSTKWQNLDLTDQTDGGLAIYSGEMAGFSIGNEQYVYYFAN